MSFESWINLVKIAARNIHLIGDEFHVPRVDARPISAQVINHQAGWYFAAQ
nr:hypothetical protein [Mycobacteroides abscessus]